MSCQSPRCVLRATSPDPNLCWIHYVGVVSGDKYPRVRRKPRFSREPLLERVQQLHLQGMSDSDIAALAAVSRREICRLKAGQVGDLTPSRADVWACRFNCHPSELWPEWNAA